MKRFHTSHPLLLTAVLAALLALPATAARAQDPDAAASSIDDVVAEVLRSQRIPGAVVAVVQRDSVAFLQAYGRTSLAADAPLLSTDAVFRAAAATELVTALAAVALAGADRLSLTEPLGTRVAGLPAELRGVTIEQLLTHTAGMSHQVAVPGRGGADDAGAAARQLTKFDRLTEPGAIYSRSVPGIMLAAFAVQSIADEPYPALVRSAVFDPLGMSGAAIAASPVPGTTPGWKAALSPVAPLVAVQPGADSAVSVPVRGLHASAPDLANLAAALLSDGAVSGERALAAGAVRNLLRPRATVPGTGAGAAAGVRLGTWRERPSLMIQGGYGGHAVLLHLLPNEGLGVIVLANREEARLAPVSNFVFSRLLGITGPPPRAQRAPADPAIIDQLLAAAGRYENASELLEIIVVDGLPKLRSGDLVLDFEPLPGGAAGALIEGRVALVVRLVTDPSGRTYLWLDDRALAPRGEAAARAR